MPIQLKFKVSTNVKSIDKGKSTPPWFMNYDEKSKWYSGTSDVFYFFNEVEEQVYIQYGMNQQGWASTRFFRQTVLISEETDNEDGSITVKGIAKPDFIRSRNTDFSIAGYAVKYEISINGQVFFTHDGDTMDNLMYDNDIEIPFSTTVQPEKYFTGVSMRIKITYPNGEASNSDTTIGYSLYNPNKPQYKPMAIRKSGTFKTLNVPSGKIQIRKSGTFIDKSLEDNATSLQVNKGKNRIRLSGSFKQLPKIY